MNLRRNLPQTSGTVIDITSLVDVVFILLIFLLISTTFKKNERAFQINLPTATEKSVAVTVQRPTVFITEEGEYYFYAPSGVASKSVNRGVRVRTLEELKLRLQQLKERDPGAGVSVLGDVNTKYQRIVDVVNQCYQSGIRRVHFPFQPSSD
jgi:biopolymer transport protein ExbD